MLVRYAALSRRFGDSPPSPIEVFLAEFYILRLCVFVHFGILCFCTRVYFTRDKKTITMKLINPQDKNMKKLLFNENLKLLMKERGYTQQSLAEKTGVSQSAISLYIRGKSSPKAGELQRMADALSVSMDYLWRQEGSEEILDNSYWKSKTEQLESELHELRTALKLLVSNVSK